MSERIALLGFGGTIASARNEKGVMVAVQSAEQLLAQVPALNEMDLRIEVAQLVNKDSSNVNIADWQLLIDEIAKRHMTQDAIVVTHGTDTMANTATAISLALGKDLQIPVVITGSQLPMGFIRTDARQNIESAFTVAKKAINENISETMIVFANRVLRGNRSLKQSEARFDAFDSPAFPRLADLTAHEEVVFSPNVIKSGPHLGLEQNPQKQFDSGVFVAEADPNSNRETILAAALSPSCTALILKSLGAGNIPSEGPNSFIPVIERTLEAGKPVILTSEFVGGTTHPDIYEPGALALEAGAGHAGNMTSVAAKVKLMWLLGQGITAPEAVNEAMLTPFVGEVD